MKIITFTMSCLKQQLIVNVITVKQQCAPSVSFQYSHSVLVYCFNNVFQVYRFNTKQ